MIDRKAYYEDPVRFTVKGRGYFPIDMLRHDRCYPIGGDFMAINQSRIINEIAVELVAPNRRSVTVDRWRSFGWVVTEIGGEAVY